MKQFKVEYHFGYGWDDAGWQVDDRTMRFNSVEEAQAEINEHVSDCAAEGLDYAQEDYRIVEVVEPTLTTMPLPQPISPAQLSAWGEVEFGSRTPDGLIIHKQEGVGLVVSAAEHNFKLSEWPAERNKLKAQIGLLTEVGNRLAKEAFESGIVSAVEEWDHTITRL